MLSTAQCVPDLQFYPGLYFPSIAEHQYNSHWPCGFTSNIAQSCCNASLQSQVMGCNPFAMSGIPPTPHYALNDFDTEVPGTILQPQGPSYHDWDSNKCGSKKLLTNNSFPTVSGSIDGQITPDWQQNHGSSSTPTDDGGLSPRSDAKEANATIPHVAKRDEKWSAHRMMQRLDEVRSSLQPGKSQAAEASVVSASIQFRAAEEGLLFKLWGMGSTGLIISLTAGSSLIARANRASSPPSDSIDLVFAIFYGYHDYPAKPSGQITRVVYQLRSNESDCLSSCFPGPQESFAKYCNDFPKICSNLLKMKDI